MFHNAKEFTDTYGWESQTTTKVLGAITDASLAQRKAEGHNTLGELAWHIATAPSYILNQCGYSLPAFDFAVPADLSAEKIRQTHQEVNKAVLEQSATKSNDELNQVYHVFGTFDWPVTQMLYALNVHEIHHRGQLSVLMRQAGLVVPSIYGPNHEETLVMMEKMAGG